MSQKKTGMFRVPSSAAQHIILFSTGSLSLSLTLSLPLTLSSFLSLLSSLSLLSLRSFTQEYRAFSRIFGSEMHSIEHENACTCVGTEEEANQVHLTFLQDIYRRFGSSEKANNATLHQNLLRKYKGMEAKLWYKLVLKYGTRKGFVDFDDSPGADFGTASESKIYTLEQLHEIREAEIEQAVLELKRRKRRQMEEEYDNEITPAQQANIDALRMATTSVRRKYETLRENSAPVPDIPRVVDDLK